MADQIAARDPNRVPALLGHSDTGETVRIKARLDGSLLSGTQDTISRIWSKYNATVEYEDDFSDGEYHGWDYQFDSSNRVGITLDDRAMTGTYSLLMHSRPVANDEAWSRKGWQVPENRSGMGNGTQESLQKILLGTYFMFHGANANNPESLNFDFDWQRGAGGSNRRYIRFQYLNHNGTSLQNKWRVNTGTPTVQAFTDVTNGTMPIAWNESDKPLLCYMVGVYDVINQRYEALYSNGNYWDLTTQNVSPTAGTDLSNYDGGAIHIHVAENRSNSSEDNLFWIEKPRIGFVYG